jgi:RNA polymerase sigma factor (sigma-70 family)
VDRDLFFRREAGRLVSALTRIFGVHNIALAEDVVQDALCRAVAQWPFSGIPENPSAWLMKAAKNRALDVLRGQKNAQRFAPDLGYLLDSEWTLAPTVADLFEPRAIQDGELRMMFSCCTQRLPEDGQVALILSVLSAMSAREVAGALLLSEAAADKKIARAKEVLRSSGSLFALHDPREIRGRLPAVQRALYLVFNEGYHGASSETAVRETLCHEALYLTRTLLEYPEAAVPTTYALLALMCLTAARLPSRVDADGDLVSLRDQDRSLWDRGLIEEGQRLLNASATGDELSEYHLEAAIAAVHANAPSARETPWAEIVELYDLLLRVRPSPVAALGRAIAIGQRDGAGAGLEALAALEGKARLERSPFFVAAMADFELEAGRLNEARAHFQQASALSRSPSERRFFEQRLASLPSGT